MNRDRAMSLFLEWRRGFGVKLGGVGVLCHGLEQVAVLDLSCISNPFSK